MQKNGSIDFRDFKRLGIESFLIAIVILILLNFQFVRDSINIVVFQLAALFGIVISLFQLLRKTHGLAIAGFVLNVLIFLYTVFYSLGFYR